MSSRLTGTSVPVLSLYYKSMQIQPADGNVGSSTQLVLEIDENPAGSPKRNVHSGSLFHQILYNDNQEKAITPKRMNRYKRGFYRIATYGSRLGFSRLSTRRKGTKTGPMEAKAAHPSFNGFFHQTVFCFGNAFRSPYGGSKPYACGCRMRSFHCDV